MKGQNLPYDQAFREGSEQKQNELKTKKTKKQAKRKNQKKQKTAIAAIGIIESFDFIDQTGGGIPLSGPGTCGHLSKITQEFLWECFPR